MASHIAAQLRPERSPDSPEDTPLAWSERPTPPRPSAPQGATQAPPVVEVVKRLEVPIDPRHHRQRKQGNAMLTYVPWSVLARCLHHRVPGWTWRLMEVKTIGDLVVVSGRLTIPSASGPLTYDAVSSEPLGGTSQAPAVETAASSCLRRAAALANLGLDLWIDA